MTDKKNKVPHNTFKMRLIHYYLLFNQEPQLLEPSLLSTVSTVSTMTFLCKYFRQTLQNQIYYNRSQSQIKSSLQVTRYLKTKITTISVNRLHRNSKQQQPILTTRIIKLRNNLKTSFHPCKQLFFILLHAFYVLSHPYLKLGIRLIIA